VSARLGVLFALGFGVFVAYLASQNTSRVRVVLSGDRGWEVPLAGLVVGAFLAGVAVTLVCVLVRDLGRSVRRHREDRASRRAALEARHAEHPSGTKLEAVDGEKPMGPVSEGRRAPERLTPEGIPAVRSQGGAGVSPGDNPRP
jgi:uncharacterized integral membrane protein